MDEQQGRRGGGPPMWWRHGPPWWNRWEDEERAPRRPWRSTALITAFVVAGSHFAAQGQDDRAALDLFARALLLVASGLLLWRRRYPVAVAFGSAVAATVYLGAGYPYGPVFVDVAVACFNAIVTGHRRAAWAAVGVFWAGHALVAHWLYRWLPPSGDSAASWTQEGVIAAWVAAIMAVSELARTRREQWARERAERAQAARRRADEERLRIARELHDVLAHSISVINVQAGVGLALLDTDPEQARTALTTIKAKSKEALGEVRQVLDTLRTPGDAPRTPAPGLDRLPELVRQAASAGLTVEVEGEPPRLSPGTDLAAFRIVQEALTNVVRHSGSRHARVLLEHGDGTTLRLRIDDDGPATGAEAGGSGNGLAGMRERAAALGGTIEAGPRADGGFRVLAVLPLTASAATKEDR
ncbi:sensor histidine kinase [Streptomyces sp. ISL-22]|uniref:sensor histidine kinase n=1 Tax=unclassified Streptomyces TaxID=2593676 RepID=UPI001BE9443F|nr:MULTISPECIES: sensor histidine kinase [unclassified Streptomyces]MBT2422020.1 sensor histidine kinase [Streptomyces sp. ISL-24]MBT2432880.1 sensor histidine kinase [Streptomyces sp. ISL-22]